MYEITVERTFCAAHAIIICGEREPMHGHNWLVTVTIAGQTLDSDGLLCDFHTVERVLKEVCHPFENRNLNEVSPFDDVNPSAEHVASHIAREMSAHLKYALPPHAKVASVRVTEADRCSATFRPDED